jgi:hypothetical protein
MTTNATKAEHIIHPHASAPVFNYDESQIPSLKGFDQLGDGFASVTILLYLLPFLCACLVHLL